MSYATKSDKELVIFITKDNESAFKEFYFRYKDRLWHYAFSFLKSKEESDDIIQEVFIRFWEMRALIDPKLSVSSFLYTMTKNRILNYFRDMNVETQSKRALSLKLPVETDSIETDFIVAEFRQIITDAIEKLPPQRQRVFNLSRTEFKSHKEIAGLLNISVSTVQEHISASLRFIRGYVSKHTNLSVWVVVFLFLNP